MSEAELEHTKLVGSPTALVRLETEASWIHQWDDGKRHSAIWKIYTADTAIVLNLNTEEVLIGNFL